MGWIRVSRFWTSIAAGVVLLSVATYCGWDWAHESKHHGLLLSASVIELSAESGGLLQTVGIPISNPSTRELSLVAVEASCGCTVAHVTLPQRIEPGKTFNLSVRVHLPATGQKWSRVTLVDSADQRHQVSLSLNGKAATLPYLRSHIQRIEFTTPVLNTWVQKEFTFETVEPKGSSVPWVESVGSSLNELRTELQVASSREDREGRIRVYRVVVERFFTSPDAVNALPLTIVDANGINTGITVASAVCKFQQDISITPQHLILTETDQSAARFVVRSAIADIPATLLIKPSEGWLQTKVLERSSRLWLVEVSVDQNSSEWKAGMSTPARGKVVVEVPDDRQSREMAINVLFSPTIE